MIVREYLTRDGVSLYRRWLDTLDLSVRARVQARVLRFEIGNLGDHKHVGGGVWEARLDFGPGYRLYFCKLRPGVTVLIVGGDKSSQKRDIEVAKRAWADLLRAHKHGKTN
ncbi:MAG TPA: type II toxin-antitoxin system RelE/ParE family toxin [Polyangia bacterium]|nr:type II toxin-antitoxin system RelE/ParE family toxin [Polyangia bacterium]